MIGVILVFCFFYGFFWSFIVLVVMFGFFVGVIFFMMLSIVVDYVGIENFRIVFGIFILG